ncbi:phenylalanine and histidine ammonia-lyase [Xylaria sp. CBS 124048]|nr:phenylalanine and histidine ammonia-lyase [Xylaria sp. CBS 124048]
MHHTDIVLSIWHRLRALDSGESSRPIVLTGRDLSIPDLVHIARRDGATEISEDALQFMRDSLSTLQHGLGEGRVIYGVNTGFGGSADVRTNKHAELQRMMIRELHYGILPPGQRDHSTALEESSSSHDLETDVSINYLPWSWARASIVIRMNSLISGYSAVRPIIVERMQDLLRHNIIPMIPLRGSISASGDLSPLSYISGAIQAKPTIRVIAKGQGSSYADAAFVHAGLEPVRLQAKEGLAMTNGTAVSAGVAALALHDTHLLAVISQAVTAMSVEALHGTKESFHSFFSSSRPHPGQIESARNMLAFLEGSKLTKVNDGANATLRQDRYAIRTAPQWLGPILEDLVLAHQQITIECNSATDNPLVTPEGEFLHGGNFQAKAVTSAMEKARQAAQGIGRMLFAQCTEIINPATNRGLTPNLVAEDPSLSLIFKGTDLNTAALTSELGFLANPVNHVQTAEMGNQSLNSLALVSARYTHTANEVLSQLIAAHLVALCQALDLRAMHIQFLGLYRAQFEEIAAKHYGSGNDIPAARLEASVQGLVESLWSQLLQSFDTTGGLDAADRFGVIARSLRPIILDHADFKHDPTLLSRMEAFVEALSQSLHDSWCANRDAYLVHGDATPVLGKASKVVYNFVRRTLNVPLLSIANLRTPDSEELANGLGYHGSRAPTVGSFTGAVYRSLRDGSLAKVVVDLLESCNGKGPSMRGDQKTTGRCAQAASDGLNAVEIDTRCIDKRSSEELSEAINSILKGYGTSAICYAYLGDGKAINDEDGNGSRGPLANFSGRHIR